MRASSTRRIGGSTPALAAPRKVSLYEPASLRGRPFAALRFKKPDGSDVLMIDGSRLEWDSIAGIGIPGAGTCISIGSPIIADEIPPICLWIDPNESLRAWAAEVRVGIGDWSRGLFKTKTGLDGEGGFVIMVGDAVERGVRDGSMRITGEFENPSTRKSTMDQWCADQRADAWAWADRFKTAK